MPSFVVVSTPCRIDKKTATPVKVKLTSQDLLFVDDEPRSVIQTIGVNGKTTFLITGSSQALRNRDRRRELARAMALLGQLRDCLLPLKDQSENPSLVTLGLQELYEWVARERERLQAAPKPKQLIGGCDDVE